MCTLVLLFINTDTLQYTTIHIGDGLIAKKSADSVEIISYPENGVTRQYTYMVNASNVFNHLRITTGDYKINDDFLIASDGLYEKYYTTEAYKKITQDVVNNKNCFDNIDDISYIIIKT